MEMNKEIKRTNPLYLAELDSGVKIAVYGDYAIGDDSRTYYHVGCEQDGDMLVTLGWSCKADEAVVV
ncbi:MAG: hypothetical protein NC110_06410 [Ruminococcus sp.]|nr:hypothetical protein [Ruminococcus sp.]